MRPHAEQRRLFRWVGAKAHVLSRLAPLIAAQLRGGDRRLVSLFYGAGLLEQEVATVAPQIAADANPDLLALYAELARDPDELFNSLVQLNAQTPRSREGFYAVRAGLPAGRCERAARFLWLSAMSFNGLWRVNRAGHHNVPPDPARLARPWPLPTRGQLADAAERIRGVVFLPDWRSAVELVRPGDVVISDPPYLGGFDAYTAQRFSRAEHEALAATLQHLAQNGCFVLAFNSPAAAPLYSQWAHLECAYRSGRINCLGHARQAVDELLAFGGRPEPLQEVA